MSMGAFAKPCAYVASAWWGWEGETISTVWLTTDAYELFRQRRKGRMSEFHAGKMARQNRRSDVAWAKKKIRSLFKRAGVVCPPIQVPESS
jgi:hypothetical protein